MTQALEEHYSILCFDITKLGLSPFLRDCFVYHSLFVYRNDVRRAQNWWFSYQGISVVPWRVMLKHDVQPYLVQQRLKYSGACPLFCVDNTCWSRHWTNRKGCCMSEFWRINRAVKQAELQLRVQTSLWSLARKGHEGLLLTRTNGGNLSGSVESERNLQEGWRRAG